MSLSLYAVNFLWIVSTGVGLALALYALREAALDKQALTQLGKEDARHALATSAVAQQAAIAIGQFAFLVAGLTTLFEPYPVDPIKVSSGLALIGAWTLTAASGIGIWGNKAAIESSDIRDAARDATRDAGRDEGRDPVRDKARDTARDAEHGRS